MLAGHSTRRGFTFIELMVSIAILVIIIVLAVPSLATYSENSKVRSVAESFFASAQLARTEAIRTNQAVQMVLTTDKPIAANVATSNLSATAGNWIIRTMSDDPTPVYTFLDGKNAQEGSNRSDGSSTVGISAVSNGAAISAVTYQNAGNTSLGAPWQVNFTSTSAACAPTGSVRCLRVVITVSGQIKICDPVVTAANDSRAC